MKKLVYVSLALLSLVVTACKEGVDFDQNAYNDLVNRSFPVENVDPTHQWATVVNVNANISVSGDYGETYEAGIYMDNPIGAEEATLLYEEDVVSGGAFSVTVSLPIAQTAVYVGVFDKAGRGMAELVPISNGMIKASIDLNNSTPAAARRAAASVSRSDYIKTNTDSYISYLPGYANNFADYYDMSTIPSYDPLNKQLYLPENNWQGSPAYGDGKSFVLPANKNYTISSNTFNNAWSNTVIIVRGTLTIPSDISELRLWGDGNNPYGQTIVVAQGGKLICNSAKLTLANNSNIINYGDIVLNGTYVDYANGTTVGFFNGGTITGSNGAGINFAGGTPYYNSGNIDLSDNGFIKFNSGITFTNVGHVHAYNCAKDGATFVNDWGVSAGAQNATVYNLCDITFEKFFGVWTYVGTESSLLYAKEGLFTNSGGQITLGSKAMIKCGDWYDNGATLYGQPSGSDFSIIKVTGALDEQNGGAINTTTGYVYCDFNDIKGKGRKDGEGAWHIDQVNAKMKIYSVSEKTAPNSIVIPADADGCNTIGYNSEGNSGGGKPEAKSFSRRYCFEDNFPDVGDYDFNDAVITVTPTVQGTTVTLKVSLDAVGATENIGAAMRLIGVKTSDLASYTVTQGFPSPEGQGLGTYENINTSETFLAENASPNNTGSFVIVLFKDAHWAINPHPADAGGVDRAFYNTVARDVASHKAYPDPAVATYTLVFKDAEKAKDMLKEDIYDVFIVEPFNGSYWEVHTVQNGFKTDQVVTPVKPNPDAYRQAYGDNKPWAIMVPGSFKYPIEWKSIGSGSNGVYSGAYQTTGHSFAEWATNQSLATDWYNYPKSGYVFE